MVGRNKNSKENKWGAGHLARAPKHFKDKYLTERYQDEKAKGFHELRFGTLTMYDYVTRFTLLIRYVHYMQEEKAKIQRFINSLPNFMKEKLEYDYPRTMDDTVRKARISYQQMKQKNQGSKGSLDRKGRSLTPNKHSRFANGRNIQQNSLNQLPVRNQSKMGYSKNGKLDGVTKSVNDQQPKLPLQCSGWI